MDLYYQEAALAIAEFLNGYGFGFDRTRALKDQSWWDTLSGAAYTLISEHFQRKHIVVHIDPPHMKWLRQRAYVRGTTINMSHQDILIYDLVDILGYYNLHASDNPPMEYRFPESFSL